MLVTFNPTRQVTYCSNNEVVEATHKKKTATTGARTINKDR